MNITHLVVSYGYAAVFALVAIESLGVPLPGETALIAAATYAGVHPDKLSVWGIFAVGAAAAIIGDTIGYWIGDKGGYRLVRRYGHLVRLDEPKLKVAHYLFDRHGSAVVFFGRFVSVLRTYAAFLAGTTRMRYRRFIVFNASGGILWAGLYTFLAYYAGSFLKRASTPFEIVFASVAVVVIIVGILLVRRHMSSLVERAEAAYPGPLDDALERRRRGERQGGSAPSSEERPGVPHDDEEHPNAPPTASAQAERDTREGAGRPTPES